MTGAGDPAELARRLREATERVLSGWSGVRPVPPATLSARQLQAVLDDLAARRAQVQALQAQLGVFDEQLATLETSLGPLMEWTRTWAGVEGAITDMWRLPGSRRSED
ncbi:hypothetical protein [Pseudonocardia broussonetiae]|uniref:Uncharacterized protein n=1 Tax=Pseudonocardia broussonetiae TaxID=2736640 RepID=A0A6M6JRM5_9PSEU|nr:hypothetical protein [Pseudonocardia broussonetiae]QJY48931.1 hypothetical protein HOP40_26730 [Pseudonocardia broussonetiae]